MSSFSATLAGVDGCRAGWIAAVGDAGMSTIRLVVGTSLASLVEQHPEVTLWAIDMPVDLPAGKPQDEGLRDCDAAARTRLGWPRSSSVFSAPPKPVLAAQSYEEACELSVALSGQKLSVQAWNLVPKVREVQALLVERPELVGRLFETHPELCFAQMNGGKGIEASKKTPEGRATRLRLLSAEFGQAAIRRAMASTKGIKQVANDDKIDALAALSAARRHRDGQTRQVPGNAPPESPRIVY
ncbi:DUF429 domain-containing protein [Botrimarina hoheduenensis]|uniref:DUF429 domain-containing protein n=1 Tax=Botrimarina hoheduenensis TaxID=2528000 RepID=UPI0018D45C84|nr:DUF429 domain-containing protein [Botrimarina hoheduenensis]